MDRKTKVLLLVVSLVTVFSITASFYKSIVLQDFEIVGAWIELEEDYSYVWIIYNDEEIELELDSDDYDYILDTVAENLGTSVDQIDYDLFVSIEIAYEEAVYALEEGSEGEGDEMIEEFDLEEGVSDLNYE